MSDKRPDTPPQKDDIAVQHRPGNAQSRHTALRPTEGGEKPRRDKRAAGDTEPDAELDQD